MEGAAAWLLARLRGSSRKRARLELLERIALGPRQSLSLIEAEGRRFLVATSAEGAPVFYPLDDRDLGREGDRDREQEGEPAPAAEAARELYAVKAS
jgi:flagellar biogenesis protein FliO